MRIIFVNLTCALLLASCSSNAACEEDQLFCDMSRIEASDLEGVSDQRLSKLTIINYKNVRPPLYLFAEEIGRRGEKGGGIIIDLSKNDEDYSKYLVKDAIKYLREYSNIDLCQKSGLHYNSNIEFACESL